MTFARHPRRVVYIAVLLVGVTFLYFRYFASGNRILYGSRVHAKGSYLITSGDTAAGHLPDRSNKDSGPDQTHSENETVVLVWKDETWKRVEHFCSRDDKFDRTIFHSPAGNVSMYIHDVKNDMYVSNELKKHGTWETPNFKVFFDHLTSDPEIGLIDLGGQLGSYALTAAKLGRQVVSIDPLEQNILRFCKSVQENNFQDKITIFYSAVSDSRRKVSFTGPNNHIAAVKVQEIDSKSNLAGSYSKFMSQTVLLDDLLPYIHFKKAVIKIDVESHEYQALRGGSKLFATIDVRAIMMEWVNVKMTGFAPALIEMLRGYGFKPYTVYISDNNRIPRANSLNPAVYMGWPFDVQFLKM
ncbi:uncharacterized protein LOC121377456 isoform X2 [Gigantopelta aegis]|uniref:uncharacterized protein LOC121377456 isoform X2 n=1 Tax=Gigantopelta aegis TaxID=1735272 RepID=UPI001B88BE5C|nr:uncharacterized protein LOC121377456 isoform X2 [Gigantopelta aegis]